MDVTEMVITHENAITHTLPIGFVPFQWRVGLKQASGMHRTKSGGFSSDEGEMPVEGDGIHPGKKTRRKSEKEMRIFPNGIRMKGGTNKRPFLRHITERGYVLSPLLSSLLFLLPGGGSWFRSPERRVGAVTAPRRCGRMAAARRAAARRRW